MAKDTNGNPFQWKREIASHEYLISTSTNLLSLSFINEAFGSEEMYWAKPLSEDQLREMLSQSQTLGLHRISPAVPSPKTPRPAMCSRQDTQTPPLALLALSRPSLPTRAQGMPMGDA